MEPPIPPSRLPELPPALTGHVGYLSVVMGQRSQALFESAMAPLGLRPALYDYLAALSQGGARSQRELARLLEVDAAKIVSLTDELEESGLVTRTVDSADRRRNVITLTRKGSAHFSRAAKVSAKVEGKLLESLSDVDRGQLRELLQKALGITEIR